MIAPTVCKHTVSGTISPPSEGCFSPFPHGTCSLSVTEEFLALRDGSRRFPQTSTYSVLLGNAHHGARSFSPTGLSPPMVLLSRRFGYPSGFLLPDLFANWSANAPQHHRYNGRILYCTKWFRLFPFRSSLLRESLLLFLPRGTEIFQFPPFALPRL